MSSTLTFIGRTCFVQTVIYVIRDEQLRARVARTRDSGALRTVVSSRNCVTYSYDKGISHVTTLCDSGVSLLAFRNRVQFRDTIPLGAHIRTKAIPVSKVLDILTQSGAFR